MVIRRHDSGRDTCLAIERHGTEGDVHANIRATDADQL